MADVVPLYSNIAPTDEQPPLLDVADCLRAMADNISAGQYGVVVRAAVVLRANGQEPIVAGPGRTTPAQTFMDLHAGAAQLMSMVSPGRT